MAICPLTSFYYSARCLSQNASTDTTTFLKLLYYLYEIHSTHISANSIHPYLHLPDNGHACRIREVYGARTHRRLTVARACHRRKRISAGAAGRRSSHRHHRSVRHKRRQSRHLPALRYVHRLQERAVCRIFRVGKDAYDRD